MKKKSKIPSSRVAPEVFGEYHLGEEEMPNDVLNEDIGTIDTILFFPFYYLALN